MKSELNAFSEQQVWLLKNGEYIYIFDIEPKSKLRPNESDRKVYYKTGHKYVKGEQFKSSGYITVIEDEATGSVISIDLNNSMNQTIRQLRSKVACYMGTPTEEKMVEIKRIFSDISKDNDW